MLAGGSHVFADVEVEGAGREEDSGILVLCC